MVWEVIVDECLGRKERLLSAQVLVRRIRLVFPSLSGGVVMMGFAALVALAVRDALLGRGAFARPKLSALVREENARD